MFYFTPISQIKLCHLVLPMERIFGWLKPNIIYSAAGDIDLYLICVVIEFHRRLIIDGLRPIPENLL